MGPDVVHASSAQQTGRLDQDSFTREGKMSAQREQTGSMHQQGTESTQPQQALYIVCERLLWHLSASRCTNG